MAYGARPLGAGLGALVGGLLGAEACLYLAVAGFAMQMLVILMSRAVSLARQPEMACDERDLRAIPPALGIRLEWVSKAREEEMAGRVALVTGGTRGIGAAISRMLKLRGYNVAANYAGNDVAAKTFKEETGIPVYKFDVSDFDAVKGAVAQIEKELGPIDIVVNNAGITRDSTMRRLDRAMWQAVIDTNLGSCFNVSKAVWDSMNQRGFGRIVNIGSINGQGGQYGQVNYAAAKSGIHGFTKALAQEGAAKGITVNAIAPGYTDTDMVSAVPANVLEKIVARIPVGRLGEADEIARGVIFLVADDAGFITGSTLSINGGQHMY
jgi:acetoacetyl-CoA reductase